jgi:NADPH:quinone reductase-like Zn-dependent oxidoreductase
MTDIPATMKAMRLTGHGGLDKLEWHEDVPVPQPGPGEVLIRVLASAVNNTDINTRIAWYSKSVRGDTESGATGGFKEADSSDSSWSGAAIDFPRIQGADCCGRIVAVGDGVDPARIGERVLVRALQPRRDSHDPFACITFGSEQDGGFAEYAKADARDAIRVDSSLSDLELASFPCAYSTAEGMLQRAGIDGGRVLVTGASGGVGSATVQLLRRRGAEVVAMTSPDKADALRGLGAAETLGRDDPIPQQHFDAVVDLVAGPRWPDFIDALRPGGRYVTAGAIAGPIAEIDVRTLYLRDLTLFGSTFQPENIMTDLIGYIERGEIKPLIAEVYPLAELKTAQEMFLKKGYVGKIAIRVAEG